MSIAAGMSKAELANARQEWRQRSAQRYRRLPGEYIRVSSSLMLVSWKQADGVEPYDDRPFDEIAGSWSFVRGTEYEQSGQSRGYSGTIYKGEFELVPEPGNPHDHTALAVDMNGDRIGYLGARYAAHHHWRVRSLNVLGQRVMVPGYYRSTFDPVAERDCLEVVVLQPSSHIYNAKLEDQEAQAQRLGGLWAALSDEVRERISGDGFHLTDATAKEILELQEQFPDVGLPTLPYADAMPRPVQLMLRNARHEWHAVMRRQARELDAQALELIRGGSSVRDASQELAISETRIRKVMKEAGVTTLRKRIDESQDEMVVALAEKGRSKAVIAEEVGISVSAVSSALRRRGITTQNSSGLNEWSRASMLQRVADCHDVVSLQVEGKTRAEIATQLGVSVETVKKRLSDGRFFDDPEVNLQRLNLARSVRQRSLTQSQCATVGEQRALTDGNVLDLIHPEWL
ncbi:hypothetical protein I6N91_05085 [Arthrobacter sp. MSA 4-2]|uniref:sigma factor-like helix-turn-helix DNA-binding protein n=1 Tax=Arthrobacter sp. MSA 4-2 TaxID=2794349 RepID=UPI0018E80E89|nr:sigma factor-like helix-turn-helix DNA-binding protein [Arthrobacter sp. MSA 4-2]MBJ2120351.1 hypothetical protein [Arthrobacter sp. MSA 4-2]